MIPTTETRLDLDDLWRRPGARGVPSALLIVAVALTVTACKPKGAPQLPPPVVQVAEVTASNVALTVEFIGQLDSPQNVEVRARVEAFVDKILFTEGTEVKEGAPLFLLDTNSFNQRLDAAKGSLAEAKAALNKYEKDVARLTPLADKHAVPQQDLDNALASVDVGKANVESAKARVESATIDLGYCYVNAPVTGLIGAKQVSEGSLVGKGQPTLMATISTLDPIWFYCNISEVDYLKAQHRLQQTGRQLGDTPVALVLADGSVFPDQGKWVFLDRAVDVTTGTLRARAEFRNPKKVLRPGMFARGRVSLKLPQESLLIQQRALQELQGKSFVWVVGSDKKVSQRAVQPGPEIGSDVVILEGLKAGEPIVVEGLNKVREGAMVQPVTAAQMAAAAAQSAKAAETKHAEGKAAKE